MRVFEWAGVALSSGGDESLWLFNLSRINNAASSKVRGSGEDPVKDLDIQPRVRARQSLMSGSDAEEGRERAAPVHHSTYYSCTASNPLLILFYVHLALAGSLLMHSGLTTRLTMLRMHLAPPAPPPTPLGQHHFVLKAQRFKINK